jgi:hypothetical protein
MSAAENAVVRANGSRASREFLESGSADIMGSITMGGAVARPRAADDFKTIRERMEELRLERARVLTRPGPPANEAMPDEKNRKGDARLLRSALLRKLVR